MILAGMFAGASGAGGGAMYLDDLGTAPLAAWWLDKVISTATNAIRVRRASDNAEQDIGFDGSGVFDSSSLTTFASGGLCYVVRFYDQTGNGYDLIYVSSTGKQPRICNASGVFEGYAVWDGSDDGMSAASLPLSDPSLTIVSRGKYPTSVSTQLFYELSANWNSNTYAGIFYTTGSSYEIGMNSGTASVQRVNRFTLGLGSEGLLVITYDRSITGSGEIAARVDGSDKTSTPVAGYTNEMTGSFTTHTLYIGGRAGGSLYSSPNLYGFVVYDGDISADLTTIESML